MKLCQYCGKQLKDDAEFCFACGRKLEVVRTKPKKAEQPEKVAAGKARKSSTAANVNKKDNRKGVALLIITLLLLALIGGTVAYLVISGRNGKGGTDDGDGNTASQVTPAADVTEAPDATEAPEATEASDATGAPDTTAAPGNLKLGLILLHDENSAYDNNFNIALRSAQTKLGLSDDQIVIRRDVPESNECYEVAKDLVALGCNVIFADSFGHEDYMIKAAKDYPDVQFCQAAGVKAHTEKLSNFHNAYAAIYDGRYLTGIAAGLKLKDMMEADPSIAPKVGFVGAFCYSEVISSYTAFYLGVKEIVPAATMEVQFTGSWYDETEEKNAAKALISRGCVIISQYSDSMGAPKACEEAGVPNVAYNSFNAMNCPNTFLINSRINWAPYFEYICQQAMSGQAIDVDWVGTLENNGVEISLVNNAVAASGTQPTLGQYTLQLKNGTLHVFDTARFTVDGKKLTSYKADVDYDNYFEADTEVIKNGYFHESEYRSAPYFDIAIDGILLFDIRY